MAAETSNDVAAETSDDVAAETRDLFSQIIREQQEKMGERRVETEQPNPRILKVDKTLRQAESYKSCFEPLVVSFGPYHHGEKHLERMEPSKNIAAAWFISRKKQKPANQVTVEEAISVYKMFEDRVNNMSSPTNSYDELLISLSKEHFIRMMFLDGCFILYFIHLVVTGSSSDGYISESSNHFNQARIVRDMFLLENQIPYRFLVYLNSILPDQQTLDDSIRKFIHTVFLPPNEVNFPRIGCLGLMIWILKSILKLILKLMIYILRTFLLTVWRGICFRHSKRGEGRGEVPLHLLHILREELLGGRGSPDSAGGHGGYWNYYFRPVRELRAAGILVRRSNAMTLKDIKLRRGLLNSHLEIPQRVVDDSTKALMLNLIAYEQCPDGPKDRMITSYICFLDSLIDHAEDVNELQSENILINRLDSSEDVSKLFKELATYLSPDSNAYAHVMNGIDDHYKRKFNAGRTRIGKWIRLFTGTYFTSPWTFISLIAAVFVVVLTLLQTIYTMWAFYKTY